MMATMIIFNTYNSRVVIGHVTSCEVCVALKPEKQCLKMLEICLKISCKRHQDASTADLQQHMIVHLHLYIAQL